MNSNVAVMLLRTANTVLNGASATMNVEEGIASCNAAKAMFELITVGIYDDIPPQIVEASIKAPARDGLKRVSMIKRRFNRFAKVVTSGNTGKRSAPGALLSFPAYRLGERDPELFPCPFFPHSGVNVDYDRAYGVLIARKGSTLCYPYKRFERLDMLDNSARQVLDRLLELKKGTQFTTPQGKQAVRTKIDIYFQIKCTDYLDENQLKWVFDWQYLAPFVWGEATQEALQRVTNIVTSVVINAEKHKRKEVRI